MEKPSEIVKAAIKSETLQETPDGSPENVPEESPENVPEESPERVAWPPAARVLTWVKGQEHCLREPRPKT
ncbi:hypothetical protein E2542_SST29086 [Spatholobus suberectus]|nr:hypothetical protein E2542_SST29086 [Spatholobus suberectus]